MTPYKVALFSFVLIFVLSACATPEPALVPVPVNKVVTVECTDGPRDERPAFEDGGTSIPDAESPGERLVILLLGINQRDRWINYLESFYAGC
jgi:hypothetical protein